MKPDLICFIILAVCIVCGANLTNLGNNWENIETRIIEKKKKINIIIISSAITIFLCWIFYLNFLKYSTCVWCGKVFKGNYEYCSQICFDKMLRNSGLTKEEYDNYNLP